MDHPNRINAELIGCPFCGLTNTLVCAWASDLAGDDWTGENDDSVHVICDASHPGGPGGCGAMSGASTSIDAATQKWNRRASKLKRTADIAFESGRRIGEQVAAYQIAERMRVLLDALEAADDAGKIPDARILMTLMRETLAPHLPPSPAAPVPPSH